MHFRIPKMIAISAFLTDLKCTKLVLGPRLCWGSLQRFPGPLAGLREPTSKGNGEEGRERKRSRVSGKGEWEGFWSGGEAVTTINFGKSIRGVKYAGWRNKRPKTLRNYRVSQKSFHLETLCNFVKSESIFKILHCWKRTKFATKPYDAIPTSP